MQRVSRERVGTRERAKARPVNEIDEGGTEAGEGGVGLGGGGGEESRQARRHPLAAHPFDCVVVGFRLREASHNRRQSCVHIARAAAAGG